MITSFIFRALSLQCSYKPPLKFSSWQLTFWRPEFRFIRPLFPTLISDKKMYPQRLKLRWVIGWIIPLVACSDECQNPKVPCANCCTCKPRKIHSSGQSQLCLEDSDLSHDFLLKQANTLLIDAVTRIMTETISALEDYHCQYRLGHPGIPKICMDEMMRLMESTRDAPDFQQEVLACEMAVIRSRLSDLKKNTTELESYMDCISRLSQSAAEAAFLANAEYASVCLMERLNSVLLQVKLIKGKSQEIEQLSNELHALIIIESGKSLK